MNIGSLYVSYKVSVQYSILKVNAKNFELSLMSSLVQFHVNSGHLKLKEHI